MHIQLNKPLQNHIQNWNTTLTAVSTSITPSLFHSRLKTYLFHKSNPPIVSLLPFQTASTDRCLGRFF